MADIFLPDIYGTLPQQRENMTHAHFNLIRVCPKNFSSKHSVFSTNTVANYLHL